MKYLILTLMLTLLSCKSQKVYVESTRSTMLEREIHKDVEDAIEDAESLLIRCYNKSKLKISPSFSIKMVAEESRENICKINTRDGERIRIYASSKENAVIGIYSYLDHLGFRFYGPEDHWTYVPEVSAQILPLEKEVKHDFEVEHLAASYAIANGKFKGFAGAISKWRRWQHRLKLVNTIPFAFGHYGTRFNIKYKDLLVAHPEYGAEINGKRQKWSHHLKLCYSNPNVLRLLKKDAEERIKSLIPSQKPPYKISLEPADKGGHCECKKCLSTGKTVSDRLYYMVNIVAKHIKNINNDAIVNLLAYNIHAAPPASSIESNVEVAIIPDKFHNMGSSERMMKMWEKKHDKLVLRGYISLITGAKDKPRWAESEGLVKRMKDIKQKKYLGYSYEVSPSFMSAGWNFYLLSRASREEIINVVKEKNEFIDHMFSETKQKLRPVFDYLYSENSGSYYLSSYKKLLWSMYDKSKGEKRLRYKDLLFYIDYLICTYNYEETNNIKDLDFLYDLVSKDNGLLNVHSWGLYQEYKRKEKINFIDKSNEYDPSQYKNVPVKFVTSNEKNPIDLEKEKEWFPKNKDWNGGESDLVEVLSRKGFVMKIYNDKEDNTIVFPIKAIGFFDNANVYYTLKYKGREIEEENIVCGQGYKDYKINFQKKGIYTLIVDRRLADVYLKVPKIPIAFTRTMSSFRRKSNYTTFFHNSHNDLIIEVGKKSGPIYLKTSEGENIYSDQLKNEKYITVRNHKNQILSIESFNTFIKFINAPQYLSYYPEAVWINN